ncbi:RNAPII degradation factor [Mortierella claussenii]|nr:RNAPII degradation factor [Mortierella claussenii]
MTFHSTISQRRPSGKDEPEDLRQLRREHGGSLATLKELFADWTEEDLLYAIQDAGGDVNLATLRISEGHATQWGEVKGKKKATKPKTTADKYDSRANSQRGGFADRGSRGRGDGFRGGRGGSSRGVSRANGDGRAAKENEAYPALSGTNRVGKTDSTTSNAPSWANITARSHSTVETLAPANQEAPEPSSIKETTAGESWDTSASTSTATDSWGAPAAATDSLGAPAAATDSSEVVAAETWGEVPSAAAVTTDSWDASVLSNGATPARKLNTATIPAGSKMSWAKIVKPAEPAPVVLPKSIPAAAPAPAHAEEKKPAEPVPEPVIESAPEPTPAVEEASEEKAPEPKVEESAPEKEVEESAPEPVAEPEPEPVQAPEASSSATSTTATTATTSAVPPGLKQKPAAQPRRLNQNAPVVMPSGSSSLHSVGLKFGSFSLNDDSESAEPEAQPETQTSQPTESNSSSAPQEQPAQPAQPAPAQPAQPTQTAQPTPPAQPAQSSQQQPSGTYGRQNTASGASGYQGTSPAVTAQSATGINASYSSQDPAANTYLGQHHHHHPGMGHDAMNSPYGSYMPTANQLGSFGMGPMASLPNDYAALYGNDIQRAMYYDPTSYGQMPVTGVNSYQSRDNKYNSHDASTTVSTTGAASTSTTQAQQTLQQQQQQQAYPNMAGGMPYYPYYYMPNQFPNAYQQSGYGQPFLNKSMYPMYQQQQQQQHSNKPGSANNSPYSNYGSTGAGQGSHHQYSQSGYDDMSGAGLHGMGGLGNDPYNKYGNPGMQSFLGGQQQGGTPTSNATGSGKNNNAGGSGYGGPDKSGNAAAGPQPAGGASLQSQQGMGGMNQAQQLYYQQQMFSNYQYPNHHQGYHPNQHQGQHQASGGRNSNSSNSGNSNNNQQFWAQN